MPDTPDNDLMTAAAAGDAGAFGTLVRRHAGPLLRFIAQVEGDRHHAEDVVQDAFLAVWGHRDQFDRARRFKPWLYRIALNRCRELQRRPRIPAPLPDSADLLDGGTGAPATAASAVETAGLVLSAVNRLPGTQRAVVLLRVWEGLSYAEIAFALSVSEGTARSHMHHALAGLRTALRHLDSCQPAGEQPCRTT